ncbi:MAG: hypothetical protein VX278_07555 [Myxococcota bacterium]|nr:hypothetical protein [Myxococcota bacterium]
MLHQSVKETAEFRVHRLRSVNPSIPESAYRKAAAGSVASGVESVEGYQAKIGWGVGVFDIPIEHLFGSINEELSHVGKTPISYTEIVKGEPCTDRRQVLMILPLPILRDRWWITEQQTNPNIRHLSKGMVAELSWIHVPTPPKGVISEQTESKIKNLVQVKFTQGSWFFVRLSATHTLAEYHSWVEPAGNIPAGPASRFASRSIEKTFAEMDSYAKGQVQSLCQYSWK